MIGNLAERVRTLREQRGWSQQHLADLIGTVQPRICEIETGTVTTPRIGTLWKLAGAFEVTLDQLFGDSPSITA